MRSYIEFHLLRAKQARLRFRLNAAVFLVNVVLVGMNVLSIGSAREDGLVTAHLVFAVVGTFLAYSCASSAYRAHGDIQFHESRAKSAGIHDERQV